MTPAKNTAAAPAETAAPEEQAPALRLVEDGETGELTREELIEHHVALVTENEAAAAELKAEAAKFTAAADSHKAEILKLVPTIGKHPLGNVTIVVSGPNRAFDAAAFEKAWPVEKNPTLYKSVINMDAVPPNLKAQCMVPGAGALKVSIK